MTTAEALATAAQAKPKHRQALDKLQGSTTAAQLSAGTATLNKRFDDMGSTVVDIQKQLDRARAGIALCADVMNINITETMQ
jgi:hypothetical protein